MPPRQKRSVKTVVSEPADGIMAMPNDFPPAQHESSAILHVSQAPPEPPQPLMESDFDSGILEADAEMTALMAELGGEAYQSGKLTINKKNPRTNKWEWLDTLEVSDFLTRGVREIAQYGPGEYSMLGYQPNKRGIGLRRVIHISEAAGNREKAKRDAQAAMNATPTAIVPQSSELSEIKEMFKLFMATVAQQMAVKPPQENPLRQMREMAEIMRALNPAPVAPSGGDDPMKALRMMRELSGLMQDLNPPTDGAAGTMHTLGKFVEQFGPMLAGVLNNAQTQSQPVRQILAPMPAAHPPVDNVDAGVTSEVGNVKALQEMKIRAGLGMLVQCAAADYDPSSYAGMILDQVPAPVLDQWLATPSLMEELAKIDPRVSSYPKWFDELHQVLLRLREDERQAPAA